MSISALSPQTLAGSEYTFATWSDGGAEAHNVLATPGGGIMPYSNTQMEAFGAMILVPTLLLALLLLRRRAAAR